MNTPRVRLIGVFVLILLSGYAADTVKPARPSGSAGTAASSAASPAPTANPANSFATFDFPDATLRIRMGSTTHTKSPGMSGRDIQMDGHTAHTGEVISNAVTVTWTTAPAMEIGDEYVIVVRTAGKRPHTFSGVFKGGLLTLVEGTDLTVEVEN